MSQFRIVKSLIAGAAFAAAASVYAQGSAQPVEDFDPTRFPGYVMEDVVVPVPSEIFAVLDKLGEPNWRQEMRPLKSIPSSDRPLLSLLFGTAVAEGFIAVEAEDRKGVEDIGREVIKIATALGLSKAVTPHANAILEAANKSDWSTIRKKFDLTQTTVRATMESMKDAPLAQCVSVGGWLRGTAAVTSVVGKNYSNDRAELLYQPMLVEHFLSQLGRMPGKVKDHAAVKSALAGLAEIKAVMDRSGDGFAPESVSQISKVCEGILGTINAKQ